MSAKYSVIGFRMTSSDSPLSRTCHKRSLSARVECAI